MEIINSYFFVSFVIILYTFISSSFSVSLAFSVSHIVGAPTYNHWLTFIVSVYIGY